jgi:hypothetical protein
MAGISNASKDVCHVFLSHAGEQKKTFVDCLHQLLVREGRRGTQRNQCINVFLDQHSLEAGNNAWAAIEEKAQTCLVGTASIKRPCNALTHLKPHIFVMERA